MRWSCDDVLVDGVVAVDAAVGRRALAVLAAADPEVQLELRVLGPEPSGLAAASARRRTRARARPRRVRSTEKVAWPRIGRSLVALVWFVGGLGQVVAEAVEPVFPARAPVADPLLGRAQRRRYDRAGPDPLRPSRSGSTRSPRAPERAAHRRQRHGEGTGELADRCRSTAQPLHHALRLGSARAWKTRSSVAPWLSIRFSVSGARPIVKPRLNYSERPISSRASAGSNPVLSRRPSRFELSRSTPSDPPPECRSPFRHPGAS